MNYYNDNDPKVCAWLRELIKAGHIAGGIVDQRSILEVRANELSDYEQHHFFAGIGGWQYALKLAGWPEGTPVATCSCPCQPFSQAGKGLCDRDERHLWPVVRAIIAERSFPIIFGEQVASKDGRIWIAGVRADMEAMGYVFGGSDLCAAGVGAPHRRQRLYWVAHTEQSGWKGSIKPRSSSEARQTSGGGVADRLVQPNGPERHEGQQTISPAGHRGSVEPAGCVGRLEHTALPTGTRLGQQRQQLPGPPAWEPFDIIPCGDGKSRRIESGTFPLAHGVSGRVGLLRGYGNAIVPQVAAEFIKAVMETLTHPGGDL